MKIKNTAIVGAGLMGNSIAQVFATNPEVKVNLYDTKIPEQPYARLEENMDIMIERKAMSTKEKEAILSRITFVDNLKEAVKDADFIIEAVPEDMQLKQKVFVQIEDNCSKKAIIGTNSSVMSSTEISSKCKHKERCLGVHFWNPGHLIPLVEVIAAKYTSQEVVNSVLEFLKSCGKKPILCKKDVPGFVANRLQHALWREAFYMVDKGIADPKTIDDAIKYGPGMRWPIQGPMECSDMCGLDMSYNVHDYILKYLADNHEPSSTLKKMLEKGKNGYRTNSGWQDWTDEEIEYNNLRLRNYLIDTLRANKEKEEQ